MNKTSPYNMETTLLILEKKVLRSLHGVLVDRVVKKELDEYEAVIRELITPVVEEITIEQIRVMRNVASFSDDLRVLVSLKEEKKDG